MTTRTRPLVLAALIALPGLGWPLAARADGQPAPPAPQAQPTAPTPAPPTPEALADAARQSELARQAQKAKRYVQAALLYEAAASLGRQPTAYHSAALAWELAERPERAADAYARSLAVEGLSAPDASQARDRLDTLEKALGTLDVKAPAGWTVQLDAGVEAAAPTRLHGVAGIHALAFAAPDRPIARRDVRLETGKTLALALKDEPAPAPGDAAAKKPDAPAPAAAAPARPQIVTVEAAPSGQVRRALGFTAIGLGVASLGAAVVLGLETIDARNAYNAAPSQKGYDHEQTLQTWTNVTLIAGAVLAVGGVVLVIWPSGSGDAKVGLAPHPGGASLVGSF